MDYVPLCVLDVHQYSVQLKSGTDIFGYSDSDCSDTGYSDTLLTVTVLVNPMLPKSVNVTVFKRRLIRQGILRYPPAEASAGGPSAKILNIRF